MWYTFSTGGGSQKRRNIGAKMGRKAPLPCVPKCDIQQLKTNTLCMNGSVYVTTRGDFQHVISALSTLDVHQQYVCGGCVETKKIHMLITAGHWPNLHVRSCR